MLDVNEEENKDEWDEEEEEDNEVEVDEALVKQNDN